MMLLASLSLACATGESDGSSDPDGGSLLGGDNGNGDNGGFEQQPDAGPAPDGATGSNGNGSNGNGDNGNGDNGNGDNGNGDIGNGDSDDVLLTHNNSFDVVGESPDSGEPFVGCVTPVEIGGNEFFVHSRTDYYKVFDLEGDFGVTEDLLIETFHLGVLFVDSLNFPVETELTFSAQDDPRFPQPGSAQELETIGANFPDFVSDPTLLTLDLTGNQIVVPAGNALLVEFSLEDGFDENDEVQDVLNIGVNFEGGDRGSFMRAPESQNCSQDITAFDEIVDTDGNNLGNREWVVAIESTTNF